VAGVQKLIGVKALRKLEQEESYNFMGVPNSPQQFVQQVAAQFPGFITVAE
jgi:hypothetical protein